MILGLTWLVSMKAPYLSLFAYLRTQLLSIRMSGFPRYTQQILTAIESSDTLYGTKPVCFFRMVLIQDDFAQLWSTDNNLLLATATEIMMKV